MKCITYLLDDATRPQGDGPKIIAHINNDVGGWGKGFVLALSKRWRKPETEFRNWYKAGESGDFRLGAVQFVVVEPLIVVANMVAQSGLKPSSAGPPIRYEALRACLEKVATEAALRHASVHMPRIGCGLAGGTWEKVEPIIVETLCNAGIAAFVYDL